MILTVGSYCGGYHEILGICEEAKEDRSGWLAFLRLLVNHGLRGRTDYIAKARSLLVKTMGLGKLRRKGAVPIGGVAKPATLAKPKQAAAKAAATSSEITASAEGRRTRKAA